MHRRHETQTTDNFGILCAAHGFIKAKPVSTKISLWFNKQCGVLALFYKIYYEQGLILLACYE